MPLPYAPSQSQPRVPMAPGSAAPLVTQLNTAGTLPSPPGASSSPSPSSTREPAGLLPSHSM